MTSTAADAQKELERNINDLETEITEIESTIKQYEKNIDTLRTAQGITTESLAMHQLQGDVNWYKRDTTTQKGKKKAKEVLLAGLKAALADKARVLALRAGTDAQGNQSQNT